MIDREQILRANLLTTHLQTAGIHLHGEGVQRTATRCPEKQHKPDHWCVSVNVNDQIFRCNDCGCGGSVIDWLSIEQGKSIADVMKELGEKVAGQDFKPATPTGKPQIVATYDYADEQGNLIYQVVRLEPKSFRQRQPDNQGGWKWTMDGVTRILFQLSEVLVSKFVIVCEGEKDCVNLGKLGFVATTSVGGAGKWLDAYSESLKGKEVVVIPDADKPGRDHAAAVVKSLTDKADWIKVVPMPEPHKDASDFIASFVSLDIAKSEFQKIIDRSPHAVKPLPIYNVQQMEEIYRQHVHRVAEASFDLSKFLPSLRYHCRPIIPGELVVIMASTGVGKTAIMQTMARAASPVPTLFFELELPIELMFERWVQMEAKCSGADVSEEYRTNDAKLWKGYKGFQHVLVCPESGLHPAKIAEFIERSELKFGTKPIIVFVDYIGLMRSPASRSRYEAVSFAAEELKVIAKATNTAIIIGTQVSRDKNATSLEVGLYDAKDSGSIENSAGLVLGCWRPAPDELHVKILKNTKGKSGLVITCNFDGEKMQITERPKIDKTDVPKASEKRSQHNS